MTHDALALLRLLQLASPTLPVGAYSYSEGLEALVAAGKVKDQVGLHHWIVQELRYGTVRLEAAILVRGYRAMVAEDLDSLKGWNQWLSAARETEELRLQSWQMGRSLLRLWGNLAKVKPTVMPLQPDGCNFAVAFAIVAADWQIDLPSALLGYLHSWATNLIGAGVKLIPLGQTAGQHLLLDLQFPLEQAAGEIFALQDDDLSTAGWGLALASMAHETQYSRLFRS